MCRARALFPLLLSVLLLGGPLAQAAAAPRRLALVIGNGAYSAGVGLLANPVHDATDLATLLGTVGFEVTLLHNADKRRMKEAVVALSTKLHEGDVGLFYYAGHGVQVKGQNYLIPIGAAIEREADVEYEAVDAAWILDTLQERENVLNIVILDACRDNPLARGLRSAQRGLAAMQAGKGALIAYSTAPGTQALDGEGRNSPYAKYLLQYLPQAGLELEDVFRKVRAAVAADTRNKQIPWESTSVTGEFYFVSPSVSASPSSAPQAPSQTVTSPPSAPQAPPPQTDTSLPSPPQGPPPWWWSGPRGHHESHHGSGHRGR